MLRVGLRMFAITSHNSSAILSKSPYSIAHTTFSFGLANWCLPSLPTVVQLDRDNQIYWDGNGEEFCMSEIKGSSLFSPIVFILDIYTKSYIFNTHSELQLNMYNTREMWPVVHDNNHSIRHAHLPDEY